MTAVADDRPVRVAALGDLHVSETGGPGFRDMFAEISDVADALALCGDLTNLGRAKEAELLAEDLRACTVPVVGVLGNHDHESGEADSVRRILSQAGVRFLEDQSFQVRGIGFAGVKGFAGGFGERMLRAFGEDAIKHFAGEAVNEAMHLESALRTVKGDRVAVVLHYAPIEATVEGEPKEIYPFLGSSRLAETIDRFSTRIRAVFHGHAHHGTYFGRTTKGIAVYNCAVGIAKDGGRPYALVEI